MCIKFFCNFFQQNFFIISLYKKIFIKMSLREKVEGFVSDKGGKFAVEHTNFRRLNLICKNNHIFTINLADLESGKWCNQCIEGNSDISQILKLLDYLGIECDKNVNIDSIYNFLLSYNDEGNIFYLDYITITDTKTLDEIQEKIEIIKNLPNTFYILINEENIDYDALQKYITTTLTAREKIYIYNEKLMKLGVGKEIVEKEIKKEIQPCIKVYGYIRVSTAKQVQSGISISNQRTMITDYAKKNGYELIKIFSDEGISGKSILNRPAIKDLIQAIGYGNKVVTYSLSRFARNLNDAVSLRTAIKKKGAELILLDSLNMNSGNDTMDDFMFGLQSLMSVLEREQTSDRVMKDLNMKSSQKLLRPKTRFGYKYISKNLPFEKDEEEQETIAIIKRLLTELEYPTLANIKRELILLGRRTRSEAKGPYKPKKTKDENGNEVVKETKYGKGDWTVSKIRTILTHEGIEYVNNSHFYDEASMKEQIYK